MKRPILNYHGGKFMFKKWIIQQMSEHRIYVEPFGGGASVLLSKDPSKFEVYNDLDKEIVNVFNCAKFHGQEMQERLRLTPYSRSVYTNARNEARDPIDKAINTVIKSFMGIGDSITNNSGFRNSVTCNTSPAQSFVSYVDYFNSFTERLRGVIIENLPYQEILEKYDSEKTLFYVDPPYLTSTRSRGKSYGHELKDSEHNDLIDALQKLKGKVLLSGYENDIYNKSGWKKIYREVSTQKTKRTEVLWINK